VCRTSNGPPGLAGQRAVAPQTKRRLVWTARSASKALIIHVREPVSCLTMPACPRGIPAEFQDSARMMRYRCLRNPRFEGDTLSTKIPRGVVEGREFRVLKVNQSKLVRQLLIEISEEECWIEIVGGK
jgi:hypothetical protein